MGATMSSFLCTKMRNINLWRFKCSLYPLDFVTIDLFSIDPIKDRGHNYQKYCRLTMFGRRRFPWIWSCLLPWWLCCCWWWTPCTCFLRRVKWDKCQKHSLPYNVDRIWHSRALRHLCFKVAFERQKWFMTLNMGLRMYKWVIEWKQLHICAVSQHLGGSVMQIFEADNPNEWGFWDFKQSISILFYNSNAYSLYASLCHEVS